MRGIRQHLCAAEEQCQLELRSLIVHHHSTAVWLPQHLATRVAQMVHPGPRGCLTFACALCCNAPVYKRGQLPRLPPLRCLLSAPLLVGSVRQPGGVVPHYPYLPCVQFSGTSLYYICSHCSTGQEVFQKIVSDKTGYKYLTSNMKVWYYVF